MFRLIRALLIFMIVSTMGFVPAKAAPNTPTGPGDLDRTFAGFGTGGTVITTGVPGNAGGMALQPDGKIVVVGSTGSGVLIMRYLPDGRLDATFGINGKVTAINPQYVVHGTSVALQANGKIVVAGWAETIPADFMVARLTATGALDTSFGADGFTTTDFDGDTDQAFSVLVQPDGKIVACGRARQGGDYDFAAARYDSEGFLDKTFAGDGKTSAGFGDLGPDANEACYDMAIQSDGKLVLVGGITEFLSAGEADEKVVRLNSDGSDDNSFDHDARFKIPHMGNSDRVARAVAIQADGAIVVAGDDGGTSGYGQNALIARILPNATMDNSFDGDGLRVIGSLSGTIRDVAVQPDGKILLLGDHASPDKDVKFAIYRMNPDGSFDTTMFGVGFGFVDIGGQDLGRALAVQPDGRIIAYGGTDGNHALLRFWPDGTPDAGGKQTLVVNDPSFGPFSDEIATGMALQADNKLILVGTIYNANHTESDVALARYLPGGQLDTSFGVQGYASCCLGAETGKAVALQPDGKIDVAGYYVNGAVTNFMLARFNEDGSLDTTFETGGVHYLDFASGNDYGTAVALAPNGKIVVAGTVFNGTSNVFGVARFNGDGTVDTTFDSDGKQLLEFVPGLEHVANAVVVQPDRKIVVGGYVGGDFALARFNEDGSLDSTFGLSGMTRTDMGGSDSLYALLLLPNGWFIAAGSRVAGINGDFALAEYKPNGTLAGCPPFPCSNWPQGKAFVDWGNEDAAFALDWRSDGSLVAAGCANGQFAWAQLRTNTLVGGPIKGMADFAGSSECAKGVKFVGPNKIVAVGEQTLNDDSNIALARFETTVNPNTPIFRIFLPTAVR